MTDVMSDYQQTHILKRLIKKNKMQFDSGPACQFNLITGTNGSARAVGLYYTANVNPTNVMTSGSVPWRHVHWNWAIERREIAMNRAPRKIVDLVKTRRIAAFGDAVKFFESRFWQLPASTDTTNIYGIPYYVVKSNTAVNDTSTFNGTVPSGYTTVAGISPTTYPRWANYARQYTAATKSDLVDKLWHASDCTDFMPLVDEVQDYNLGDDYLYATTYSVRNSMKQILESQNDNLGFDLDPSADKLTFRRAKMVWVKELDQDTTNPVYGLNFGVLHAMGLRGEWMNETTIPSHSSQPTVAATYTDCTLNLICTDRRRNFVLATNTGLP